MQRQKQSKIEEGFLSPNFFHFLFISISPDFSLYSSRAIILAKAPRLQDVLSLEYSLKIVINMIEMFRLHISVAQSSATGKMMIKFIHNEARPTQQSHTKRTDVVNRK